MPLLPIVLDILPEVEEARLSTPTNISPLDPSPSRDGKRPTLTLPARTEPTSGQSSARSSIVGPPVPDKPPLKSSLKAAANGHRRSGSFGGNVTGFPLGLLSLAEKLDQGEARDLLLCVLYLLKNVPEEWLGVVWRQLSAGQLLEFLHMLE